MKKAAASEVAASPVPKNDEMLQMGRTQPESYGDQILATAADSSEGGYQSMTDFKGKVGLNRKSSKPSIGGKRLPSGSKALPSLNHR